MDFGCSDKFGVADELVAVTRSAGKQMGIAQVDALEMCNKYDDNFDILDNPGEIDNFLRAFLGTFDDSMVRFTPVEYKCMEGAGSIARNENGEVHIGVDEDIIPSGDIVPVFDGLQEFLLATSAIVKHRRVRGKVNIPELDFTLSKSTKLHRSNAIEPLIAKLVEKKCVFVDPPYAFSNYCDAKGVVWYEYVSIAPELERLKKSHSIVVLFESSLDHINEIRASGVKFINISYCPYYPVSAKYTETIRYDGDVVSGTAYINRHTFKFRYDVSGGFVHHPFEWSSWLGLPASQIHVEWLTRSFVTNFEIQQRRNLVRSRFFPYVVEAYAQFYDVSPGPLRRGSYNSRDSSGSVIISDAPNVRPVDLVSMEPINAKEAIVKVLGYGPDDSRIVYDLRTFLGWPHHANFYMLQGEYYQVYGNDKCTTRVKLNCLVATEMSNVSSCITSHVLNVNLMGLSTVYRASTFAAYHQHYMAIDYDFRVLDNTVHAIPNFDIPPINF